MVVLMDESQRLGEVRRRTWFNAPQFIQLVRPPDIAAVQVPVPRASVRPSQGQPKSIVARPQCFDGPPLFGRVAHDFRSPDDLAVRVSNRRNCQRDIDMPASLGNSNCFVMLDPLPTTQPLQNRLFITLLFGQKDQRNRLPYRLLR